MCKQRGKRAIWSIVFLSFSMQRPVGKNGLPCINNPGNSSTLKKKRKRKGKKERTP
jgi:hypothetical protein